MSKILYESVFLSIYESEFNKSYALAYDLKMSEFVPDEKNIRKRIDTSIRKRIISPNKTDAPLVFLLLTRWQRRDYF